ncbi:hypothetical protein BJ138DRAFT_1004108 [Hygrophoropsis aurantiaca]|uniref:Uncharacterized protein n=1 Tax=Hygrophoropsis aurantiaca TaxID=72124 RepID=A0ACB8AGX7_9AGAM|nr:hypothetical protein BJ138DRAFT_1004108 [Hygrophoropsis aurantiaca]
MPESEASLDLSISSYDSDEEFRLAQKEWNESLEELQQLAFVLLMPWAGKYLGRRCSYWLYDRYTRIGLGKSFFIGQKASSWTFLSL